MASVESLNQCIQQQLKLLADFVQLLTTENQALLADPSNQDLVEITTHKNDYARRLASLDSKRTALLADLGYADDAAGINSAMAAHPALKSAFNDLWQLADQAETINNENGQLLSIFIEDNQRAIGTLRSLMGEGLYDSKGKIKRNQP